MPQGAAGLNLQQWLQDNQGNSTPPTDPWITPWTNQNNLSNLKDRTEANIRQHYQESLPGLNVTPVDVDLSWWDGLVDAFTNVVGSLPEWLDGLRTVLEWVGTNFNATFRPVFEWFMGIITWLKTNVADTLIQAIFNTLKTINNSVTLPIFEGIIQTLSLFKPVLDWFSSAIGGTAATFWNGIIGILDWIDNNLTVPIVQNVLSLLTDIGGAISNTILKPALELLAWAYNTFIAPIASQLETWIKPILTTAWDFLQHLFGTLFPGAISNGIKGFFDFIHWLWMGGEGLLAGLGSSVESFLKPVTQLLQNIWNSFSSVATQFGQDIKTVIGNLFGFLRWLWSNFGAAVESFLKPLFTSLNWVWTNLARGTTNVLNSLIAPAATFLDWVFNDLLAGSWSQVQAFLAPAFEFLKYLLGLFNLNGLQDVFSGLKSLVNQFGSFWNWVDQLAGVQWIKGIVQSITGVVSDTLSGALQALLGWAQNIPGVSMIIAGILGPWKNPATGTNTTLPDLIAWSTRQLTIDTIVPSQNLVGYVPQELMALLPVGHVSDTQPNLVTDQAFASDAALQSGAGWSWSGETATGSSGGSAKVVGDGGIKQLFSNLIAVSPGQQLSISARTKWTKPMSAMPAIVVGVRGYEGEVVKFTTVGASVTGKANYANNSAGASSYTVGQAGTTAEFKDGWVTITGSFTIPAATVGYSTSNCRMYIGAINAPTGTTVWFDEVVMKKTSLLPQDLVSELNKDLGEKLPGTKFDELLQNIANKTGATVDDVKNKLATFLNTGTPVFGTTPNYDPATGKYVINGNIDSKFISELVDTWTKFKAGAGNNAPPSDGTALGEAAKGLGDLAGTVSQNSGLQDTLSPDIALLKNTVGLQDTAIKQLQSDVLALQSKVGSTQTTQPPTTPTISAVLDDFERPSLGAAWSTPYLAYPGDGSSLGIPDSHSAKFTPPATASNGAYPALYSGTGPSFANLCATIRQQVGTETNWKSNSVYQRIYATIGAKGGVNGTASGWNDLIGRASSTAGCIVARFWASGKIELISRTPTGGYGTEQVFATFNATNGIGAGASIELRCGDKASGRPELCTVKVGTNFWTGTCPTNSSLNYGWGFGMGTGVYRAYRDGVQTLQAAGTLQTWGAEDQT